MNEPVVLSTIDDPDVLRASAEARATFRYFWRELHWERRRIVPGLDMAMVKLPFTDSPHGPHHPEARVESMWVEDVDFDGHVVSGTLTNSPNWLRSVKRGDRVAMPFAAVGDWIMAANGIAYGAHTVQVMRAGMAPAEREEHDGMWGLVFGDPSQIRVFVDHDAGPRGGILDALLRRPVALPPPRVPDVFDHPMCINMVPRYDEQLAARPSLARQTDDRGWTFLHHEALAGNLAMVELMLRHGADPAARTADGRTAADLAAVLGWDRIVELLRAR